jgi:hypothetical protein
MYVDVMERTTVYLDTELRLRLKEAASRRSTTEAALIREALERFLAKLSQSGRRTLKSVGRTTDGGVARDLDGALDEIGFGRL